MEPKTSAGQGSFQDNSVEATSTPDDVPTRPQEEKEETGEKGGAKPVKPSDASENTQGNEVRDEDMEPSDDSETHAS